MHGYVQSYIHNPLLGNSGSLWISSKDIKYGGGLPYSYNTEGFDFVNNIIIRAVQYS